MLASGWTLALALASVIPWREVQPGLERAEFLAARSGPLSRVRIVALRLDPCRVRLELVERSRDEGTLGAWAVDSLPDQAMLAFNAGQFRGGAPWGWHVRDGVEVQPPGSGTLAMAITLGASGRVSLVTPAEIPALRTNVRAAFQSYPTLLVDSVPPRELRAPGRGVDLMHRDSRLALGTTSSGQVLLLLTRFEAVAGIGSTLPYGPTIPELATLMRRLGATRAVGLDGGLSSQLAMRERSGALVKWTNWRLVPMGVVGRAVTKCYG
ncbi:MAG: phosphodiester glycosidase family protein [Gemmatimonadota bacterium]